MKVLEPSEFKVRAAWTLRLLLAVAFIFSCEDAGCPAEELVASPISSNLVDSTVPVAGEVVASFSTLRINFLKPVDRSTFSISEDIRVTRQRGIEEPEAVDLFSDEVPPP